MRAWYINFSKNKQKGQITSLALRIPIRTKTLVLILSRITIQYKISILGGTNPFHSPLKELQTLDCIEIDNIQHIDLIE
jgi:hypothetical protein